jgi:DNA (cytosine-5)-methyltransferase 1
VSHVYYNEIDLGARRWLRELMRDGLIPDGFIDNRPIQEVRADELLREGFTQCHFFAGIGGWPLALELAGWPEGRPVWTGSCPCQPFSDSGERMGFADPRHLFPTFRRLIARCQPPVIYGEQVASSLGREWLARVRLEMASLGYATRGADLCSAGVTAPNIRQRLYWVADTTSSRPDSSGQGIEGARWAPELPSVERAACGLGNSNDQGREGRGLRSGGDAGQRTPWASGTVGLKCADGKTRRIKPEIFPLAARLPGDLGLIRGAGNAINPWIAAEFIKATIEN